jgi:hypothetical protein
MWDKKLCISNDFIDPCANVTDDGTLVCWVGDDVIHFWVVFNG